LCSSSKALLARLSMAEEWPELAYGTRAAEMLATLSGMGRLIVVGVAEGYLIVTPEVIAQALMPDGRPQLATLEQQFGKGVQAGDFLEGCAEALPSLLVDDKTIEASVRIHSTKALNKEIARVLTRSFVWKGVRVTASADGASGYQDEATSIGFQRSQGRWTLPLTCSRQSNTQGGWMGVDPPGS